ncbi:MAG: class III cytochrome C family protein [Alphaproteobacteria bacterium]|nr:class III cytochrome C family protein [Alphaproteobacteria bacterium]
MKSRILIPVLLANLAIVTVLVFVYPHLMVSPGQLTAGHAAQEGDCFACHDPFLGTPAKRCESCHTPERIGRFTTKGVPVAATIAGKGAFHQTLKGAPCVACHSDHRGVAKYRTATGRFAHAMLNEATRQQCATCHAAPVDAAHRQANQACATCHRQERWKPATLDHSRLFALDRDHDVKCATCHTGADYKTYTCYGCHEHSPAKIASEHREEGIRDYENCVRCHKNANEHDIIWDGRGGDGPRRKHDD